MTDLLLWSLLAKLVSATVAVAWLLAMNLIWNLLQGGRFDDGYDRMARDARAFAHYHGDRLIAFAIIIGFVLG